MEIEAKNSNTADDRNANRSTSMVRLRKSSDDLAICAVSASARLNRRSVSSPRRRSRKLPLSRANATKLRRLASAAPIPTSAINIGISGAVVNRIRPAAQFIGKTVIRISTGINTARYICGR
ncbi:hypothetical protein D3C81_1244820 [compost metagenome]